MSRFSINRITSALAKKLGTGTAEQVADAPAAEFASEPTPQIQPAPLPAKPLQPACEDSCDESDTAIVTMNQSIKAPEALSLTVRAIFNNEKYELLIKELIAHLRATANDDTFTQVHTACRDYIAQQLQTAEPDKKPLLLAAQSRLHLHFVQATDSEFAYDPATKPNPKAVYYPNPKYGQSLYDELPFVSNAALVTPETSIICAGKGFAQEIAAGLRGRSYRCLTALDGEMISSAAHIRQLVEFAFGIRAYPHILTKSSDNGQTQLVDPLRPHQTFASAEEYEQALSAFLTRLRAQLSQATVCLLSLSTTEIWRLSADNSVLPDCPTTLPPYLVQANLTTARENVEDLQHMLNIWRSFNSNLQVIVGISPLPLQSTFRKEQHVVTATAHAKATLRVAVDEFVRANAGIVHYIPAYDAAMYATENPITPNGQELSDEAREKLLRLFEAMFVDATRIPTPALGPQTAIVC